MQELVPEPIDLDAQNDELVPEPAKEPSADGAAADGESKIARGCREAGRAPVDRTLDFLARGNGAIEAGRVAMRRRHRLHLHRQRFSRPADRRQRQHLAGVTDVRFLVRELTVPMEYRVGLHKRVQGFINMPVGWANTQINVASGGFLQRRRDRRYALRLDDSMCRRDGQLSVHHHDDRRHGADGRRSVYGRGRDFAHAPSLGDGFWSVQGTVLFIQQYDPVVLFYGLGMERSFPHEYVGIEFVPGAQYNYLMGVGFAVNERITLSTRFFGSYVEELEANGSACWAQTPSR